MGEVSFRIRRTTPLDPSELWERLERGSTSGWPLLDECRRLTLGAPLRFTLAAPDATTVTATGRIVAIEPGKALTIAQETPWQGRVRLEVGAGDGGAVVRLTVSMDDASVQWLLNQPAGAVVAPAPVSSTGLRPLNLRVGLLAPLSGIGGVLGRSIANAATLAVEELNASGAFGRRSTELYIEDDRTEPMHGKLAFNRLVRVHACDVVLVNVSSATIQTIRPLAETGGTLVLNTALSERQSAAHNFLHLGESPTDQLWESIPQMMRAEDTRHWFILGNDYVWPRTVGMVANELVAHNSATVAGEAYVPLGTGDFDRVLDRIESSGADVVLSSLIGIDAIRFEQAFYERGYRNRFRTLATNLDDTIVEHIGRDEAAGIWSAQDYFMPTLADEMDGLARRYRQRFGDLAPQLTSMAKAAYDAVHLWAQAVHVGRSQEPSDVARLLRSGRVGGQRIHERIGGALLPTSTAEVTNSGFRYVSPH
ncbi:ABC transporter substrate-binding protein [Promicromonospora soli]